MGDDLRSIHFLPFPHVRKELIDPVIERQVKRMQNVIELARQIRNEKEIFFKVSLSHMYIVSSCS